MLISSVIAHRGASKFAPENTLAAFKKAQEIGAKWVELDVQLTACGELVVIHDETIDRTTNGSGYVSRMSYEYLRTLDAGSWFNPIYKNERIPTLAQVMNLLSRYKMGINIEIKPALGEEEIIVQKVLAVIQQHWPVTQPPLLLSSFSDTMCHFIRKQSSSILLAYLMDEWQLDWEEKYNALHCNSLNVNHVFLTEEIVKSIKLKNYLLLAYTVDDPARAQELFSWGVDSIFSNCPKEMCALL